MNKTTATAINKRLLHNLVNKTTDLAPGPDRIDSAIFTDPALLEKERRTLFFGTGQPLAFSGELPTPGSFLTLQVLDTPVLLTRDEHGVLHGFINACRHRGAPVAVDCGEARSLVCSFHGWSYHLDGRLRGRPETECFTSATESLALQPLPVSEKYGVIVVAIGENISAQILETALDDIGAELATFGFEHYRLLARKQFEVDANWKLINDLSLESYHFTTLHRDSVAQMLASNAVVDTFGQHSRWAFPLNSITRLADLPQEDWPDRVEGSCTYTLFPGTMLLVNSLGAQMIRAEPGASPGHSLVTYTGVYREGCDIDAARAAFEFGGEVFANEDLPMAAQCQRGLTAGATDIPLGRNEPLLQFWHQLWRKSVAD